MILPAFGALTGGMDAADPAILAALQPALAIDAVLRDSRVAAFTLTGQAAVRLSWGETPGLLIAAGGFHPRFVPPSDSPALSRLTLALGRTPGPLNVLCLGSHSDDIEIGCGGT